MWFGSAILWTAREAYELLLSRGHVPAGQLHLLHARMVMGERLALQDCLMARFGKQGSGAQRTGHAVEATQIVEASLDADWDQMVTDLAPIDAIIQRIGPQMRHPRDRLGRVVPGLCARDDARDVPHWLIHVPAFAADPEKDWYKKAFGDANYVYSATHLLWHTQRLPRFAHASKRKRRTGAAADKAITFSTMEFRGLLTVTDEALFQGLGAQKVFGPGLLLVRRL